MERQFDFGHGLPTVCRLGLATRGNTHLDPEDVHSAVERGVNYLNWCGQPDGMSRAIAEMGTGREKIVVAWQMDARSAEEADRALDAALHELGTEWIDIVTFYYVESEPEWTALNREDGAYAAMERAREQGKIRLFGMTSHQRKLAVRIARGAVTASRSKRPLDMLMLRYNAAHRGAEREVFPFTNALRIPVVVYTCLRWGALMRPTPEDPPGFTPPPASEWYRFALANPSVAVALTAPNGRAELDADLMLLGDWRPPTPEEFAALTAHGERVYRTAGRFP